MDSHIKVTVIIPFYNVSDYIERCAQSLMNQSMEQIELIFVDDCSSDDSIDIISQTINKYQERKKTKTRIVRMEKNGGPASARNKGLDLATGEFIAFCDADDCVEPDMYEIMYNAAKENNADVALCDFVMECGTYQNHCKVAKTDEDKITFLKNILASDVSSYPWFFIASRKLYEIYNLRFPQGKMFAEDTNLAVRLFYYSGKVINVHAELYHYNLTREQSLVSTFNESKRNDAINNFLDLVNFFKDKGIEDKLRKELSWRVLKYKQEYALLPEMHEKFLSIYPESSRYIWGCPWCNWKNKLIMWCLTHHFGWLSALALSIRKH